MMRGVTERVLDFIWQGYAMFNNMYNIFRIAMLLRQMTVNQFVEL